MTKVKTTNLLGLIVVGGFMLTASLLVLAPVLSSGVLPVAAKEAFLTYFNAVGSLVCGAAGFYFGRITIPSASARGQGGGAE